MQDPDAVRRRINVLCGRFIIIQGVTKFVNARLLNYGKVGP